MAEEFPGFDVIVTGGGPTDPPHEVERIRGNDGGVVMLIELDVEYNRLKRTQTPQDITQNYSYFDERLIPRLRMNYSFSTDMFISAFVQMNTSRSEPGASWHVGTVTSNLLFGYNMQQGHTFYLAYNAFADDAYNLRGQRPLRPASQTVVAKFSYLFNL